MKNIQSESLIYLPPSELKPWERNPRKHPKKQLRQLAKSLKAYEPICPVIVDEYHNILCGHGRVEAAKLAGIEALPCRIISHLTNTQKRAYIIADNKLAQNATWDEDLLALEIEGIQLDDPSFDLELTGFSPAEIDGLFEGLTPEDLGDPAEDAPAPDGPTRCLPGQLWGLGNHRLICGDARNPEIVAQLMGTETARMAFTDPPYNVPINGHVGGSGKIKHPEFAMGTGEMSREEFIQFLKDSFQNMVGYSCDGAIHFICMDWRHVEEMMSACDPIYSELKNLIVWVKDNGGMGSFYRSRHEFIFAYKVGNAPHLNTFELGQNGRYRTNVWNYRGVNTFKSDRMDELTLHPTVKPVQLISDAIKDVSVRGDIVLDLFGGSGSTLIAAEKTGRRAFLCEIDPVYCDRTLRRWEAYTNDNAELLELGQNIHA